MPDLPDLKGRVKIDTSDIEGAVGRASRAGSLIGSALGTLGGNVASGLLDTAFSGVKALTVGSVMAASDLSETANKIKTVFGPAAAQITSFASTSASKFGLSQQAAMDASATFGVFGKAAGLSGKSLGGFSTDMTALAADLASFNNTTPEEAILALGAGLRGESEPLRRFGVLLDDASLRAQAMKMGLIDSTKNALTPQQKVLASQALIMKQTSDAQGDFAKTSDGLANRTRIAKAEFADLQTKLGTGFLPIVNLVMGALVKLFGPLGELATRISTSIGPAFAALTSGGGGVSTLFSQMGTALSGLGAALSGAFTTIGPTLASLGGMFREQVLPALMQVWQVIATNVIPAVSELVTALAPIVKWMLQAFGPIVIQAIKLVYQSIAGLLGVVGNLVRFVARLLKGDWAGAWQALKAAALGAVQVVVNQLRVWLGGILPAIFRGLRSVLGTIWNGIWSYVKTAASTGVSNLMGVVRSIPGKVRSALGNVGGILKGAGRALIQGLIDGVMGMIGAVGRAASSVADKIRSFFPGSPVKAGPLRSWNNGGAGVRLGSLLEDGLQRAVPGVGSAASRLAGAANVALGTRVPGVGPAAVSGAGINGTGTMRLDPRDLRALADALGVTVLLDSDQLASKVGSRIALDTYDLMRAT